MAFEHFASAIALIGVVILVSSLLSGAVERSGVPQVAIFLLLGAAIGPAGLGLFDLSLRDEALVMIATTGLLLVLFTDAIAVDVREVRAERRLALWMLGPGTIIPAMLIALAAWLLLDLHPAHAAILGAALASTDPVLLRTLLRQGALPGRTRLALRLESGMNDVVLLPVVVLAMLFTREGGATGALVGERAVGLFILGPALGVAVGYGAIRLLESVRRRLGVRRDYESLYALGIAFTAYAAAEAAGGSGFLSVFAAALVVAALDVELCDCFLDYGEATAEMFLLFTFVAFGASLIWIGFEVASVRTLAFAGVALLVRTAILYPVLSRAGMDARGRRLVSWLGPRGLSSLLLALLPVFAGMPGAERLFAITALVVLLSVVAHGGAIAFFLRRLAREGGDAGSLAGGQGSGPRPRSVEQPAPREEERVPERITIEEMRALQAAGEPVTVADARTERAWRDDPFTATGAVRLPPDDAVRSARELGLDRHGTLVIYCA